MKRTERPALQFPIPISARRLPRILAAVAAALVAVHLVLMVIHYRWHEVPDLLKNQFDLDEEQNIPNWYSSAILLLSSGLLLAIANAKKRIRDRHTLYWYVLCVGFALMSLDEEAGIHETINTIIEITWAIPGAVLVGIIGLAFIPFLIGLPARTRWWFVASGAVYVGGAVGMEIATDRLFLTRHTPDTLSYNVLTAVEEGMEMFGVVLFIRALLAYMRAEEGVPVEVVVRSEA
jgi:hypothetical protein